MSRQGHTYHAAETEAMCEYRKTKVNKHRSEHPEIRLRYRLAASKNLLERNGYRVIDPESTGANPMGRE